MIAHSLVEEIVRLCRDRLGIRFLQARRGVVRAVAPNGTCTVDAWSGTIPKVSVLQPWPGCSLTFSAGADVLLAWPRSSGDSEDAAAPGQLPVIVGFYTGTAVSVDILPGGASAARVGDSVLLNSTSDPNWIAYITILDTYLRPLIQATGVTLPALPVTLTSKIATGSTKVRIG